MLIHLADFVLLYLDAHEHVPHVLHAWRLHYAA
jgi:hypothetical protein